MLISLIFSILLGICFGTITGLTPGIHTNLISSILLSLTTKIYLDPTHCICFIVSLAITHTFVDFIPSIFLGCPDTETELSVLPGHQLLKNKRGYEAVNLANKGSLIAIILTLFLIPLGIFILPKIYPLIKEYVPFILISIIILLILKEKNKFSTILVLFLTGILGISTNQIEMNQPLLPLLTGLFGASNIVLSIKNKTKIPEQIITKSKINLKRPILGSIISAPFCSFFPGLGSGQAAIIGNIFIKQSRKQFLVLTGIINTLVMSFSIITLYAINKTRTGAAIAIQELFQSLQLKHLILLMIVTFFTGIFAYKITDFLAKIISIKIKKIDYKIISYITLCVLCLINILICGPKGLIVLIISTLTGIFCIKLKVRRTNMMGVVLIPTIIWLISN